MSGEADRAGSVFGVRFPLSPRWGGWVPARLFATAVRHDPAVPDDLDYEWFGWFVEHPEQWSEDDLDAARFMLTNQKRAVREAHPRDRAGRQSLQETVDALEAAIKRYVASGT